MERGDLRVRRQIARINGEVVEAPLKTKNAYRTFAACRGYDRRSGSTEEENGRQPLGIPQSHRRADLPDSVLRMLHRVAETGGPAQGEVP